ncbi:MAG: hypothetical protein LBN27_10765 [Prevotellaceae bacterium]|jgi:hypothetical protein|nr:hypothetical protein [Prevotellaceae bacterium]
MKRITLIELEKDFEVPEMWDELTPAQVRFVFQQWSEQAHKDMRLFYSRLLDCFLLDTQKPKSGAARRWSPYSIELAQVLFSFLMQETNKGIALDYPCVENHLPYLHFKHRFLGWQSYVGADSLLGDLTFAEFDQANKELQQYATGSPDNLYRFIACLYRPVDKMEKAKGIIKPVPFDEKQLDYFAGIIKKNIGDMWKLDMIAAWYANCVRYIQEEDINIDGNTYNFGVLFKSTQSEEITENSEINNLGWYPVLYAFAEDGIFGNLKETYNTPLFDMLRLMLHKYNEGKRIKKEYEKINNKH